MIKMNEKPKAKPEPKGIVGSQPECAPVFDSEVDKARKAFEEKYGISYLDFNPGDKIVVSSFQQALDAQAAGYSFELKVKPLDEELDERGL